MDKIEWCLEQKKGIELVEPNDNLCEAYFKDANDSLSGIENVKGMWRTVMAYYSCYFSFYALLMKVGIKCEIHDCTLALMGLFGFDEKEITFVKKLKKERINVQYYHQKSEEVVVEKINSFVLLCKSKANVLKQDEIDKIRGEVKND